MSDHNQTIVELLDSWIGGAATTLVGALMGRVMWHFGEVRKGKRQLLGIDVLWELPIAFGMALIGEGISTYLELSHPIGTALVAALAYFGPRGAEVLFLWWFRVKIGK